MDIWIKVERAENPIEFQQSERNPAEATDPASTHILQGLVVVILWNMLQKRRNEKQLLGFEPLPLAPNPRPGNVSTCEGFCR